MNVSIRGGSPRTTSQLAAAIPRGHTPRSRRARRFGPAVALAISIAAGAILPAVAQGHNPDPSLGGAIWSPNQAVAYTWAPGQVPPTWLQDAFNRAGSDSNRSRESRAATFTLRSGASSLVAYGQPTGCSAGGIACFSRVNAPWSFRVWYRAHGYRFDWGTLLWCQGPSGYVNGCYDAETIALDELGHIEGLDHHVNYADQSDYGTAVVQAVSRSRPRQYFDAHAYGTCDVARLQITYDRRSTWDRFATCLSIPTWLGVSAASGPVLSGTPVAISAYLYTQQSAPGALAGDPISGRTVTLQRRPPGGSTWTSVATMVPVGEGAYATTISPSGTYDWRAVFATQSSEGLIGYSSDPVTISTRGCSVCPAAATAP